jgi:hypothetical protein
MIDCHDLTMFLRLYNEAFHNLYSSPNIFRMIKSRKICVAEHVTRMAKRKKIIGKSVGWVVRLWRLMRIRDNDIKIDVWEMVRQRV